MTWFRPKFWTHSDISASDNTDNAQTGGWKHTWLLQLQSYVGQILYADIKSPFCPLSSVSAPSDGLSWITQTLMIRIVGQRKKHLLHVAQRLSAVLVILAELSRRFTCMTYLFKDLMMPTTESSRRSTPVLLGCSKPGGGADRTCFLDLGWADGARPSCRVGSSSNKKHKYMKSTWK